MIVRILGEGQFEVPDDALDALNRADDALVATIEAGDEDAFRRCLTDLHAVVQQQGTRLPDDYLGPSDLALPADDATLAEVRDLLGDEGLVPG